MSAADEVPGAARLRNAVFQAEHCFAAATGAADPDSTPESVLAAAGAAETALLQLQTLLSVTAGQAADSRQQAASLQQLCVARLHALTVQQHRSESRWVLLHVPLILPP